MRRSWPTPKRDRGSCPMACRQPSTTAAPVPIRLSGHHNDGPHTELVDRRNPSQHGTLGHETRF
eukprot:9326403-Lingulodinium_polyedra.AAC.1